MTSSVESSFAAATEMFKEVFEQVAKEKQGLDKEKQRWEKEKMLMDKKFVFNGPRIVLDVGGMHYSTSRSTLTKYPESMLGVMFSGRHDLETMQCKDGSFFIDRDGTHFRHILNYLRDGDEVVGSFPKSLEVLSELIREAKYYQLDGLTTLLKPILQEIDVVNQNQVTRLFSSSSGTYYLDYDDGYGRRNTVNRRAGNRVLTSNASGSAINVSYHSKHEVVFRYKTMKGLSFSNIRFVHPVSFIDCDLSNTTFQCSCFESDAIFEGCILDNTMFNYVKGLVTNSCKVSFTGSKTDKANFDPNLRSSLQSSGKIP